MLVVLKITTIPVIKFSCCDILPYHKIAGHKYEKLRLGNNMKNYCEPSEKELSIAKEIMENQKVAVNIGG